MRNGSPPRRCDGVLGQVDSRVTVPALGCSSWSSRARRCGCRCPGAPCAGRSRCSGRSSSSRATPTSSTRRWRSTRSPRCSAGRPSPGPPSSTWAAGRGTSPTPSNGPVLGTPASSRTSASSPPAASSAATPSAARGCPCPSRPAPWTWPTRATCSSTSPPRRRWPTSCCGSRAPGGLVVLSWTPWLSPWGGHETAPWHYLGGRRAADRYAARHGRRPKNDFGRSLFACSVGRMARWLRAAERAGALEVVEVLPRYHPSWAKWVVRVPGLREVASWNAVLVVRRLR